jgi:hypothetical protein
MVSDDGRNWRELEIVNSWTGNLSYGKYSIKIEYFENGQVYYKATSIKPNAVERFQQPMSKRNEVA